MKITWGTCFIGSFLGPTPGDPGACDSVCLEIIPSNSDTGVRLYFEKDYLRTYHFYSHILKGHGFGWTLGVNDGQGGLACCSSWGRKESDTTELSYT